MIDLNKTVKEIREIINQDSILDVIWGVRGVK